MGSLSISTLKPYRRPAAGPDGITPTSTGSCTLTAGARCWQPDPPCIRWRPLSPTSLHQLRGRPYTRKRPPHPANPRKPSDQGGRKTLRPPRQMRRPFARRSRSIGQHADTKTALPPPAYVDSLVSTGRACVITTSRPGPTQRYLWLPPASVRRVCPHRGRAH